MDREPDTAACASQLTFGDIGIASRRSGDGGAALGTGQKLHERASQARRYRITYAAAGTGAAIVSTVVRNESKPLRLVLGSALDVLSAIIILTPLVVLAYLELGFPFPPFGLNLFPSFSRFGSPMTSLYRHVVPFLVILGGACC